jgi:ComF family protein
VPAFGRLLAITHALALVPVPVHAERLRQRGYNQAGLIAAALSRTTGLPIADLLERRLPTTRQHHLDRGARIANLRGAFAMREGARAPPRVILVDDILTTSATLESCARVLRSAGAARVHGFAIAREV